MAVGAALQVLVGHLMEAPVAVVAWDCLAEAVAALAALQILRLVHMGEAEVVAWMGLLLILVARVMVAHMVAVVVAGMQVAL